MAQVSKTKDTRMSVSRTIEYVVSACLIGKQCFYDGSSSCNLQVKELFESGKAKALCPEELGGLKTPRPPAEIFAGSGEDVLSGTAYVYNKAGKEATINYIKGSKEFLAIVNEYGIKKAILKARSPCCDKGKIYDGTFRNRLKKGNGVTAALLLKNGIEVESDEEFSRSKKSHVERKTAKVNSAPRVKARGLTGGGASGRSRAKHAKAKKAHTKSKRQ